MFEKKEMMPHIQTDCRSEGGLGSPNLKGIFPPSLRVRPRGNMKLAALERAGEGGIEAIQTFRKLEGASFSLHEIEARINFQAG